VGGNALWLEEDAVAESLTARYLIREEGCWDVDADDE
jgi:hypothetical protein